MKTLQVDRFCALPLLLILIFAGPAKCYDINIFGYAELHLEQGDNLVCNPLLREGQPSGFTYSLRDILATYQVQGVTCDPVPVGSTASIWDTTTQAYTVTSTWTTSGWSNDLTILPGQGFRLNTPSPCAVTFVGLPANFDGQRATNAEADGAMMPPTVFAGASGVYLFSSKGPMALGPSKFGSVWTYVLDRSPNVGEQFTWLDAAAQQYHTTTFTAGGWDNGEPSLAVGQSAFFNVGPVPEPATVTLLALGAVAMLRRGRKRCR